MSKFESPNWEPSDTGALFDFPKSQGATRDISQNSSKTVNKEKAKVPDQEFQGEKNITPVLNLPISTAKNFNSRKPKTTAIQVNQQKKSKITKHEKGNDFINELCPFGKPAYLADIVCAMMWRDCFAPDLTQQAGTQPFSL